MNLLDLMILQVETLLFGVNLIIALTLICGLGLVLERVLRNFSVPLRNGLLFSALLFALFSPMLIWGASYSGLGVIRWTFPQSPPELIPVKEGLSSESEAVFANNNQPKNIETRNLEKRETEEPSTTLRSGLSAAIKNNSHGQAVSDQKMDHEKSFVSSGLIWAQVAGGIFFVIWGVGFVFCLIKMGTGWKALSSLWHSLQDPSDERVKKISKQVIDSAEMNHQLPVFESPLTTVPISFGLWKPAIVLPEDIGWELEDKDLKSVLLHESAHIIYQHHWGSLTGQFASAIFWWHPLVHLLNRRLSDLREDICDNYVVSQNGDRKGYAHLLVELAARTTWRPKLSVAIGLLENNFEGLEGRVQRLLKSDCKVETRLSPVSGMALGLFAVLLTVVLLISNVRADPAETRKKLIGSIIVETRDELITAVQNAKAGTKILIAPGNYIGGLRFENLKGSKGKPIILAAREPDNPPHFLGGHSGLHFTDPAYVELHHLVILNSRENGLNIDDGGSYDTPAHHIVLRGVKVRDIGSGKNHDGIKLSGVDDFRLENCSLKRWGKKGSGIDMVGCHRGVITRSIFEEGDRIYGNAIQMKGGSRNISVSYCRFENAGGRAINIGGSTGLPYFRPKPLGYEAKEITVSDSTFVGSMGPIAFVGVDGASVHNNVFYRPTRWAVRILQENRNEEFIACRNGVFANNIVVFRSDELAYAINIGPGTSPKSFKFSENMWYCLDRPEKSKRVVQLPSPELNGVYGEEPQFANVNEGDFRLVSKTLAKRFGPREKRSP